ARARLRVPYTMQPIRRIAVAFVFLSVVAWVAPSRGDDPSAPKPLKMADVLAWKHVAGATVSPDGQWFAYLLAPNEGDGEVVVRQTRGDKEMRFPAGEARGGGPGPAAGGGPVISEDSQWVAFAIHPTTKEGKLLQKQRRPSRNKAALVRLASGEKTEFDGVRRSACSGESATTLALHGYGAEASTAAPAGPPTGPPATTPPAGATPPERPTGSDLVLRELATGNELNVGNVAEFAFDKKG